mmetsp:Transcript_87885/g.243830  ORF Transcript_87885/g.243830 Transcript_87885/m.243830 type:complete len:221 (-) Transcript_87885:893-1555(-)
MFKVQLQVFFLHLLFLEEQLCILLLPFFIGLFQGFFSFDPFIVHLCKDLGNFHRHVPQLFILDVNDGSVLVLQVVALDADALVGALPDGDLVEKGLAISEAHGLNELLKLLNAYLEGCHYVFLFKCQLLHQPLLEFLFLSQESFELCIFTDQFGYAQLFSVNQVSSCLHVHGDVELQISNVPLLLLDYLLELGDLGHQLVILLLEIPCTAEGFRHTVWSN